MDECRLCGTTSELQSSHIIPRFVIKWMKKTGPTPFLRKAVDPNTRIQDYHEELLCKDCEQIFSEFEGKFAAHVFYPHVRGDSNEFEYGEWLYRFVLSVSWRLLVSDLAVWHEYEERKKEAITEREETWRQILLGEKSISEDPSTHHIFFLDKLDLNKSDPEAPDNFEMYMQRGIDGTSIYGDDEVHVYFKFPKIIFFSTIDPPNPSGFTDTEIQAEGVIQQPQELGPKWGNFLTGRIENHGNASMSDHEREKVTNRILDNPERYFESEFFEAQVAEMRRKWAEHDLTDYLDESECPVCYANHRVIESLPKTPLTKSHVDSLTRKVPFARGTFPEGGEVKEYVPTNVTDTLIISTTGSTKILQFFMDYGWIVGEELEHHEDVEPEKVGRIAWEKYSEDFHKWIQNKHGV